MKASLYLCLTGLLLWAKTQPTFAQKTKLDKPPYGRSSWQIGLKEGYGSSPLLGKRNTTQLAVGYFVVNRLLVGLASSYSRELAESIINKKVLSVGPLIRYQFISGRLSPYTEFSYQLGRRSTNLEQSLSLSPGLSLGLVAGLKLDLGYNFQYINSKYYKSGANQATIGINYLFGSR